MPRIKRSRVLTVHPPEAEQVAQAFEDSRNTAESDRAALENIFASLEAGWEGNQKTRYAEELRIILDRLRTLLIPALQSFEKKYRGYTVEKTVEETVNE